MSSPTLDDGAWERAAAQLDAAGARLAECEFDEAERLASGAAAALLGAVGPDHPDYANALDTLGQIARALGRPREAVERFEAALTVFGKWLGDEDDAAVVRPYRASTLCNLGEILALEGRYEEADAAVTEALAEAERAYGPCAGKLAETHNLLGVVRRFAGRYEDAEAAYRRAAAVRAANGEADPATHFHNLSGLASARGDFARAEAHARAAIAARATEAGDGVALGTDWCGLGDALAGQGRHAEAEAAYREGLALYARSARPDHPEVAYALHNLGDTLAARGRVDDAEAAYRTSIERKERAFGPDHHEIAASLANLAALYAESSRLTEARATIQRAAAIARARLPGDHPVRRGCDALAGSLARDADQPPRAPIGTKPRRARNGARRPR